VAKTAMVERPLRQVVVEVAVLLYSIYYRAQPTSQAAKFIAAKGQPLTD
jgi:hypothetical protein